jgi:hypothetical protein
LFRLNYVRLTWRSVRDIVERNTGFRRREMLDRFQTIWVHEAHGCRLVADFQIHEGQGKRVETDEFAPRASDIRLRKVPAARLPSPKRGQWLVKNAGGMSVATGDYGTLIQSYCGSNALIPRESTQGEDAAILISRGKSISTTRFNHTILHAFIPQILALQGEIVLHTTSVVIDGSCYLFAGDSGMGKSTLAAGFASRGHTIYSEDIARIDFDANGRPQAFPSYPGVRLRGNSFLLPAGQRTNEVGRFGLPKFRVSVATSITSKPAMPVKAIFFLRHGHTVGPRTKILTPMQAIKPYLKASFLLAFPKASRSRVAFGQAVKLAGAIPAYELRYLRSAAHFFRLLDSLIDFIETT